MRAQPRQRAYSSAASAGDATPVAARVQVTRAGEQLFRSSAVSGGAADPHRRADIGGSQGGRCDGMNHGVLRDGRRRFVGTERSAGSQHRVRRAVSTGVGVVAVVVSKEHAYTEARRPAEGSTRP